MKKGIYLLLLLAMGYLQTACGKIDLAPYSPVIYSQSATEIQYCTTKANTIQSNLKFIFVVDRSGSNQQRYDVNNNFQPYPGTDPLGNDRFNAILNFISQYQGDPTFTYWSMINFASKATTVQGFTNDATNFSNVVLDQKTRTAGIDGGDTDYLAAVNAAKTLIQTDAQAAAQKNPVVSSTYVIFFVSDGAPFIINSSGQEVLEDPASVLASVSALTALEQADANVIDSIQINTGYYFTAPELIEDGQDPRDLLGNMADTGHGSFLDFGSGENIDFSNFAVPSRVERYALKDIWVANANAVWWGGKLMEDSDGDGIPDDIEVQLGSDPNKYDSDGNGVGDGVELRMMGKPCQDAACSALNANPFTTCQTLPFTKDPTTGAITYADTDRDYLNDCEERLINSDKNNPQSNNNYVPDWMAFINHMQMTPGASDLLSDPFHDGLSNYEKLKQDIPLNISEKNIGGLTPLHLTGTLVSSDDQQDCYSYNISSMPVLSAHDHARIFVFENSTSRNQKIIYRTAEKLMTPYGQVSFSDSEIK